MVKGIKICGISDLETLRYILNHQFPPSLLVSYPIIRKVEGMWNMGN